MSEENFEQSDNDNNKNEKKPRQKSQRFLALQGRVIDLQQRKFLRGDKVPYDPNHPINMTTLTDAERDRLENGWQNTEGKLEPKWGLEPNHPWYNPFRGLQFPSNDNDHFKDAQKEAVTEKSDQDLIIPQDKHTSLAEQIPQLSEPHSEPTIAIEKINQDHSQSIHSDTDLSTHHIVAESYIEKTDENSGTVSNEVPETIISEEETAVQEDIIYQLPEPGPEPWASDGKVRPEQRQSTNQDNTEPQSQNPNFTMPPKSPPPPTNNKSPFGTSMPELPNDNWFEKNLGVSKEEFQTLIEFRANHETRNRYKLFWSGVLFFPITLVGAIIGYIRGYNRFERHKLTMPNLYPLKSTMRVSMAMGILICWVSLAALGGLLYELVEHQFINPYYFQKFLYFYAICALICVPIYGFFMLWRIGIKHMVSESRKFGSARFARQDELFTLKSKTGYYIGQGHLFQDRGHLLTVAGTRGGKGTNIIVPNLLGAGNIDTSWVVIDPKGENAAITADYQRQKGQNVVILNPWALLSENVGSSQSFNPLDMLPEIDDPNLVDDVQMLAEMIVPIKPNDNNSFFTDSARILIAGLLLHLVTTQTGNKKTLKTLWEWCRLETEAPEDEVSPWDDLLADMGVNDTPVNGEIVQNARREILRMSTAGGETFGSIMSDVLLNTDFLKSPSLQESLQSGFNPKELSAGKTTVYIIIPADKLKTHARWLRLVTTSLIRAVIRRPNKRVTFMLDEFAALGHMSEIETALSTYAGYNVTVWPILQTLGQLIHLYDKNWQTFIGNCTVRQYFSLNDNESAEYVSAAIGTTSNVSTIQAWFGVKDAKSNQRYLITPDELRRESGKAIFIFIADLPATFVNKLPYYKVGSLNSRAKPNPYMEN